MTRRMFMRAGAVGLFALALSSAPPLRPAWGTRRAESLDPLLETIRERYRVPALGAAFCRDDELVAAGTVGIRRAGSDDPVRPSDGFQIGSCTKSMSATLLAMLVERGRLAWETTIAEALPHSLDKIHHGYHCVTLLQLLKHRGGLPEDSAQDPEIWSRIVALAGPLPAQRVALAETALAAPPAYEPGTEMIYTNFSYVIAGAFAEHATGRSWEDLMQEMLFAPLGMTTAGFGPPGSDQPWGHMGQRCRPVTPGPEADNPPVIGPAATVHCSLSDWARYAALHLRGARGASGLLLRPDTFKFLHTDWYRQGYAVGWAVIESPRFSGAALTHAGATNLWYADIVLVPAHNAGFMVAVNCGSSGGLRARDSTLATLIDTYL